MNMEENTTRSDVIILGAGLAGLAAAEGVLRYGEKPLVIEKEEIVGGLCASVRKNGFIFDFGGHRFLPHHKETADFARNLFPDNSLVLRNRRSQIYLNGKFLQSAFFQKTRDNKARLCLHIFIASASHVFIHGDVSRPVARRRPHQLPFGY